MTALLSKQTLCYGMLCDPIILKTAECISIHEHSLKALSAVPQSFTDLGAAAAGAWAYNVQVT